MFMSLPRYKSEGQAMLLIRFPKQQLWFPMEIKLYLN